VKTNFREDKILLVLTLIIGAVVGLAVVLFIVLTENLGGKLYPPDSPAWRRVLLPVVGSLVSGFLLYRYFPDARGSGIPQTKAALFLREGHISFRTVLGKFGLCSLSLASGIALGREGPSVHVGAGIASTLGRKLRLSATSIKALIPIGASAALAAAFNTPISAVLFSLEEVMGDMHAPVLGSVVLSSATSWMVLHLILGDEPLFHVPAYQLVHPVEFLFYAALGLVGGLVSVSFVKLLLWLRAQFLRAPRAAAWLLPAVGGVTVGMLGWFYPAVLGVGYSYVGSALNGQMVVGTMALMVLLKAVATTTCYASGNAGGIFGPSLFMGAMMGGAVGGVAHMALPDYTGSVGAYALVGMGAVFAGIIRVPLTSVIMIFEITRDYSIIVPLMIANLISYFISSRLQEEPIYEALQHQDGVYLPSGARARETLLTVEQAYRPNPPVLDGAERIDRALLEVDRGAGAWAVTDAVGLLGVVTLEQLEESVRNGRGESSVAKLAAAPVERIYPDEPLEAAMRRLAGGRVKALPVVSRTNLYELKGMISLSDILSAYALSGRPEMETQGEAPAGRRLLAGLLAAVVAVAIAGGFLSYYYRAERGKRGEQAFAAGEELLRKERLPEAIEQFRYALSISHRADHRLALGLALVQAGRANEAAIYLREILRQQPNSGPANLGMADAIASEGQQEGAIAWYRRAIAGSWPDRPAEHRYRARMRLMELFVKHGDPSKARAELPALAADLPEDRESQQRTGRMMIDFGLLREAEDLFQRLLKSGPPDPGEYGGLGEALFRQRRFEEADAAFRDALRIDPTDATAARRAALSEKVLASDPGRRGIGSQERFRRSEELLRVVLRQVEACGEPERGTVSAIQQAKESLSRKRAPGSYADEADRLVSQAEWLWSNRPKACSLPADDPAAFVLAPPALPAANRQR
jgi:CIC family chloride channel protein